MTPRPLRSTLFPYTTLFRSNSQPPYGRPNERNVRATPFGCARTFRSEEHTSELQSRFDLVCRLLLEKKKTTLLLHGSGQAGGARLRYNCCRAAGDSKSTRLN